MTLQFQSMVPIFEIVMTIAAYAPHLVALLCVLAVMVKPGIRKWLAIGPLLMFFSLAGPQATWYVGGMYTVTWLQQYCGLNETQALAIGLAVNFSSYLPSPLIGCALHQPKGKASACSRRDAPTRELSAV